MLEALLGSTDLWLPALRGSAALLGATRGGHAAREWVEERLGWLSDPAALTAFREAFTEGVQRFQADEGSTEAGKAAVRVLARLAEEDRSGRVRVEVLRQLFADRPDTVALTREIREREPALEGLLASPDEIAAAFDRLVLGCLRPAFRAHPFFAERVGLAEIIGVLREIRDAAREAEPDLDELWRQYRAKTVSENEYITMQGISPKVQNRTIGIRMEDVFIPIKASLDEGPPILYSSGHGVFGRTLALTIDPVTSGVVLFDPGPRGGLRSDPPRLADALPVGALLRLPRLVVRGDPGSGKSTFTRYAAWAAATGRAVFHRGRERVPVRIRAIELGEALDSGRAADLFGYLLQVAGRFEPLVSHALFAGSALVLIDGLDEIGAPALRARVKEQVDGFVADPAFADNQIVVTTRIVGYERSGRTGAFPHVTIADLDDEQISGFVTSWYGVIRDQAGAEMDVDAERAQLLEAVLRNASIRRMARNPLLLTIIALIKWQGRALPDQRVLLYDAAAQTLIRSWPLTQRRVELDELFIREWLAPVAFRIFSDPTGDLVDEYTLMEELVASMRRLRSMPLIDARQASSDLLSDVSEHSGILLPRGTDADGRSVYGFLHQTFGEYLTAHYLAGRWEDEELELLPYAHDPYWREVILLMAGHLGTQRRARAGQLLRAIRDLNSSPYEPYIHRDLLLAGEILADGVPAGPGDLVESLLGEMVQAWLTTPIHSLRIRFEDTFHQISKTEYADVLGRIARGRELTPVQLLTLAQHFGARHFGDELAKLLDDPDPVVRLDAASMLVEYHHPGAAEVLRAFLHDPDTWRRFQAAAILMRVGDEQALRTLLDLARDESAGPEVVFILKARRRSSIADLLSELVHGDAPVYPEMLQALGQHADPALIDLLHEWVKEDSPRTRLRSAVALLAAGDASGREVLADLLSAEDDRIRWTATVSLATMGDPRAIDGLLDRLRSGGPEYRNQALDHLLQLAGDHADRIDVDGVLAPLLRDRDEETRLRVAEGLFSLCVPGAGETLSDLLEHGSPESRRSAAFALLRSEDPATLARVASLIDSDDPELALAGARAAAKTGDPRATDALVRLLGSADMGILSMLRGDLVSSGDPRLESLLEPLLDSESRSVRSSTVWILAMRKRPESIELLRERIAGLLQDGEAWSDSFGGFESVADGAYLWLSEMLTPAGDLALKE